MLLWKPDPTFYPSPRLAMQAPAEGLAYVATIQKGKPDALRVVDLNPNSPTYGKIIHSVEMPYIGDELHHFGWNACSSALCPYAPHPYLERRYLLVPGLRSSRIYIMDTKPDPMEPHIVKIIEPKEVMTRAGYTRLHTVHCGPEGIYISALGSTRNGEGPGGVFLLDHYDFQILGRWEVDRGPQFLGYDFWWHLGYDVGITSEWGPPSLFENGLHLEDVVNRRFGHRIHFWDIRRRKHLQALDLGEDYQMVLELRPAHDPTKTYGFVGVVVDVRDLSSSVWLWYREKDQWAIKKVIQIPAESADPEALPPILKDLKAVPPLITDINLSLDDRFLYVSCWGSGELRQYDVSDPFNPKLTGSVQAGGLVRRAPHPKSGPLEGGPQMVEVSRDGRRIYFTNSLYSSWDDQFYPNLRGWMVKVDARPEGGISLDPNFFVDFGEIRPHQVRLQGGDSSSDSFCFP
jgi:selenium-binding protein 1